jgi:hypothetical protein
MTKKTKRADHSSGKLQIDGCVVENMGFAAKIPPKSIKVFFSIIKAVLSASNSIETSEMQISERGVKYIIEESKSFQASTILQKNFFDTFKLLLRDGETISFGVNLKSFTELLSGILNDNLSGMNMVYYPSKDCVSFSCKQTDTVESKELLDDSTTTDDFDTVEFTTEYFVKTMESLEPIDFEATTSRIVSNIIINATDFHGLINDFDRTVDEVEIKVTEYRMTMKTLGMQQVASIIKLDSNNEIFFKYDCHEESKFFYKFSHFKAMLKPLTMSSKISLVTHADGMLRTQLMVANDDEPATAFMEYNMLSSLPPDDEDEEP